LSGLQILEARGNLDIPVSGIAYHSGLVEPGGLFVALKGAQTDGHRFVEQAIQGGARIIVSEAELPTQPGIVYVRLPDTRLALAHLSAFFYNQPSHDLTLIGITGTNGKTTTSYLLEAIYAANGLEVGVMGTVNCRFGSQVVPSAITTPESLDLQCLLDQMRSHAVSHVVLEVSSHALDLKRVHHCRFAAGIFTNLSQDHLDYHGDLGSYFEAKSRLFTELLANGNKSEALAIINGDDPWGQELLQRVRIPTLTYGFSRHCDVRPEHYQLSTVGSQALIVTPYGRLEINSELVGRHNLYNILAASTTALGLGSSLEAVANGLAQLSGVEGRLERIVEPGKPVVFVDYAHTPDALSKVLAALKALNFKRLITVFGCGGDRDCGKRPLMGQAAVQGSDLVIITSDNPRSEVPLAIITQIEAGVKELRYNRIPPEEAYDASQGYLIVEDRREAIRLAVQLAQSGDAVLIAGKGHETYQILGNKRIFFDDRQEARLALQSVRANERLF
jgi:UDP-N-acetylmuramyl-tripeptide synthetase